MNTYRVPDKNELSHVSKLFLKWLIKYPNSRLNDNVLSTINSGYGLGSSGHFVTAIIEGNLDAAYAHADSGNLKILEELTGMTKNEFGLKYWGWTK